MIELDRVTKRFGDAGSSTTVTAVDDLSLTVGAGEVVALVGTSGSGKTTTLRMINRLIEPTEGTISIDGADVGALPTHELRRGIGYVIQHAGLFPHRTILANITTVPRLLGWNKDTAKERAMDLLTLVGLNPDVAKRYPGQLSGGQQQRVGVARALAADPPVLLMDEPFGAVDPIQRNELQHEFSRLQQELGKTVVFVTHDVDEAIIVAHRMAILQTGGVIAQLGTPRELLDAPKTDFVRAFLGGRTITRDVDGNVVGYRIERDFDILDTATGGGSDGVGR